MIESRVKAIRDLKGKEDTNPAFEIKKEELKRVLGI